MGFKELFLLLLNRATVKEGPPLTQLEYLSLVADRVEADLTQSYTRRSMYLSVTTMREDIYDLIGTLDECSMNIRQLAAVPKGATKTSAVEPTKTSILREFIIDYEGRSQGRIDSFQSLVNSTRRLVAALEKVMESGKEYDYRHYLRALEPLLDEVVVVMDTYLNDAD